MPSRWEVALTGPRDVPVPPGAPQAVVSGWLDDRPGCSRKHRTRTDPSSMASSAGLGRPLAACQPPTRIGRVQDRASSTAGRGRPSTRRISGTGSRAGRAASSTMIAGLVSLTTSAPSARAKAGITGAAGSSGSGVTSTVARPRVEVRPPSHISRASWSHGWLPVR